MSDLIEIESRLAAALNRLANGIEHQTASAEVFTSTRAADTDAEDLTAKVTQLEEDISNYTTAMNDLNDELEEITNHKEALLVDVNRLSSENAELTAERDHLRANAPGDDDAGDGQTHDDRDAQIADLKAALEKVDGDRTQLVAANAALLKAHDELRTSYMESLQEPEKVDASLQAALDALEAERAAERVNVELLEQILTPIVEDTKDA
ncbi:MAG: hypothetical protein ACWA40_08385 [Planktomarina sp.]